LVRECLISHYKNKRFQDASNYDVQKKEKIMSQQAVESVIGKALLNVEFRKALLADADKALADFDLTDAEKASLKSVNPETMESLAHTLDARVSKLVL
jgi:hypothetical protein